MNLWADAACARLDIAEGIRIFCPETEGGALRRTTAHPKPDSHPEARRICPACPVLESCLAAALQTDEVTFRGLSPEERAVFGGVRMKRVRSRPVRLTPAQVLARVADSGYDPEAVLQVLAGHDQWLQANPAVSVQPVIELGWSDRWLAGTETFEQTWAALNGPALD